MMDQMRGSETIFALSSGALPSGVAVVRLSGGRVADVLRSLTGSLPNPREATLRALKDTHGEVLDRALVLYFPGPASFTGEDCAELQLHGGRAVVDGVLDTLRGFSGLRFAEAGEFTKRAFVNGKIDLTGAEALSDLISAETQAQRRFALANGQGAFRALYNEWRATLIQSRAFIEAELDFSDEEDVPGSVAEKVWSDLSRLHETVIKHAASYRHSEIIRDGYRIVILGPPNAGKSSLLNALAKRDVAIVTDEAGTTRDVIEVALEIEGAKVIVSDTAGLRTDADKVEAIGISRALERAGQADMILLLEDMSNPIKDPVDIPSAEKLLRVGNKCDLVADRDRQSAYDCLISVHSGEGLETLLQHIGEAVRVHVGLIGDTLPFRARHVALLSAAAEHIERSLHIDDSALELRAEELRLAADTLGRIAGSIDVEDLLDAIFSQFCIGK